MRGLVTTDDVRLVYDNDYQLDSVQLRPVLVSPNIRVPLAQEVKWSFPQFQFLVQQARISAGQRYLRPALGHNAGSGPRCKLA